MRLADALASYSPSPTLSAYAAAAKPDTPTTVKAMEQHHLFGGPLCWDVDLRREVMINFAPRPACVPMPDYDDAVRRYGRGKATLGHLVVAFREKKAPDGSFTKCRARITYGDKADVTAPGAPDKHAYYSGCADSCTNRIVTQVALQINAEQSSDDVSGAY